MENTNNEELVTVVENNTEKQISQKTYNEMKDAASSKIVEANDGKKHVLKRLNG